MLLTDVIAPLDDLLDLTAAISTIRLLDPCSAINQHVKILSLSEQTAMRWPCICHDLGISRPLYLITEGYISGEASMPLASLDQ